MKIRPGNLSETFSFSCSSDLPCLQRLLPPTLPISHLAFANFEDARLPSAQSDGVRTKEGRREEVDPPPAPASVSPLISPTRSRSSPFILSRRCSARARRVSHQRRECDRRAVRSSVPYGGGREDGAVSRHHFLVRKNICWMDGWDVDIAWQGKM